MDNQNTSSFSQKKETATRTPYVYAIIRSDIPDEQRLTQLGHAAWHAGQSFSDTETIPSFITLAVKNQAELIESAERLTRYGINFHMFHEPDFGPMGYTAICTETLSTAKQRKIMYKWSTYKSAEINNV